VVTARNILVCCQFVVVAMQQPVALALIIDKYGALVELL